jgi:ATP-dependent helicase/nuclease subunit A
MTHDQHIASDPSISAWVSASAGTGKTKVLTDRVLRLLLAGAEPQGILCITYTKAASAEMESRISAELAAWVTAEEKALKQALLTLTGREPDARLLRRARRLFARVLDAPQRMRIQTIHSFCQSILGRFPLEAGVPPHFTPIDEATARELLAEARSQLFASAGRQASSALGTAVAALASTINDQALYDLIAEIVRQRRAFSEWFASAPQAGAIHAAVGLAQDANEERLLEKHLRYAPQEAQGLRRACEALAQGTGKSDRQTQDALRAWLEKRIDARSYARAFITLEGKPRERLHTKSTEKHWPQLAEVLAAEQRRVLACFEDLQSLKIAEMSSHVAVLAGAQLELYHGIKERHGYLDYDDQILYTARLLQTPGVAPWVLYKLDGGIDHLLIDEAQDTSPEQWRIVDALAAEFFAGEGARSIRRTLFVVGDEKQSIFSFQGAAPATFDAMQRKLSKLASGGADFRRVRLALSFRSASPVLKAVDSVFAREEARDGLIFTETDIRHEVHRSHAAGRVVLWPLAEAPDEDSLPAWHIPDRHAYAERPDLQLAQRIAATIDGWLKADRILASQGRNVTPGDIMILVQRRGTFADAMLRELKRGGIPVAGADRLILTEHIAVADCLALARFLLLPQDDLTLAIVLKSPFVGLSEEALFELAYQRDKESLWHRLKNNPAYAAAYEFLSGLLAATDYMPPYELFAHVLETCGGRRKLAGRLGSEIDDPLNEFLALAIDYGKTHTPSLQGFVHWLEAGATEIKRDMEKGRDEVRILTVHGAKGLQAPIVFLPDTTRMPPHEGGILWTGGDTPVPLWSPAAASADRHYRALKEAARMESEREHRRLLYVAMTRAEDELYICGWKGGRAVDAGCWYELVRGAAEGWEAEGEHRFLHSPQSAAVKAPPARAALSPATDVPEWAGRPAADEPLPPRPLTPSRLEPIADVLSPSAAEARERGQLVHRLLQYLPEAAPQDRGEIMARFFARHGAAFSLQEQQHIAREVLAIIDHPEFSAVFGPDSAAEVSIAGMAGEEKNPVVIAGRIDRLAILPHDVYIVDYKTGRKMPANACDVPAAYLKQMDSYRQLVSRIYPDKTVHCALLWTAQPMLMVLPDALLQSLAA